MLGNQARADQAALRNHVLGLGGAVAEQFWALSACVVEIQPGLLPALRAHRDVVALFPDDERDPAEARSIPWIEHSPVLTGTNGTDAMNHNVPAAQALLGHKGLGARLAVLDTGIDSDQSGTNTGAACGVDPDPHRAFRDAQGVSRVEAHLQVGSIGCNSTNPPVDPWCPGTVYLEARHGTGVAAIAAGAADSPTSYFCAGHAEEASIISVVISNTPQFNTSPWATSASTVIAGIEAVQYHMLAEDVPVHVANYSYDGWPDPDHPTQHAFDLLERNFDVLVVTAAANEGDAATISSGFTNGLHVGNVHRFAAATARYPHRLTSRGPLFGDADRYYPDVCASGASAGTTLDGTVAQIVMPLIDDLYTAQSGCAGCMRAGFGQFEYNAQGTSMAAPQVSGAALLYRAERPSATAQETRAALLLTSVDPFVEQSPVVDLHHTYVGRNSHGVGYVRDDLLARYALRLDQALGQSTTLTPSVPDVVVGYSGLLSGDLHAVAIAWPRIFTEGDTEVPWANVDLEIRTTAGALLARSDSLRNPYERLVFKAAGVSTVQVHVLGVDLHGKDVPVFVAARRLGGDGTIESKRSVPGYVAVLPQEAGCTMSVQEQSVSRTLPSPDYS